MNKKNIFHFKPTIILLLIISTIILLVYSLAYDKALDFIKYFSYLYSTFSLMVVIFNIKRLYLYIKSIFFKTKWFNSTKKLLYKNKIIKKYFEDVKFKTLINLCISVIINFGFIFIKLINGITNKSVWFISLALYYFLLTLIKIILLNNLRKYDEKKENKIYRNVGYFIMALNIALVIMIIQMIRTNVAIIPKGYIIYLTALYSFYLIISAIINVIKYRKFKSPILSSVKVINLLTSSVSILMLQTTMIATFGENELEFMRLMNSITGGIISVLTLSLSTYMIIKGQNELKSSEY